MKKISIILFIILSSLFVFADNFEPIPELNSRVTDAINLFSAQEKQLLEQKLTTYEQNTGSQIVVLIISTTGEETIEEYSMRVAEKWKIGTADNDDGIILIIAKNDRKLRIEVGYGFEGNVPDIAAKWIIDEKITPEFKKGDFVGGINKGVDMLINMVSGTITYDQVQANEVKTKKTNKLNKRLLNLIYFIMFAGPGLIATVRKRDLKYAILLSIIILIANIAFGFMENFIVMIPFLAYTIIFAGIAFYSRGRWGHLTIGAFRIGFLILASGGGGSSSSSSSFGGGGFSGGGGSFGGGGASGSW